VVRDVNNLDSVLRQQGDLERARASFERALRILENSQLPPDNTHFQNARNNLEALG
jgi:Tfp pilus assembly protein PilF